MLHSSTIPGIIQSLPQLSLQNRLLRHVSSPTHAAVEGKHTMLDVAAVMKTMQILGSVHAMGTKKFQDVKCSVVLVAPPLRT